MKRKFRRLKISRSTVYKIQRKYLQYTYKRITKFRPRKQGNKILKRIAFIQKYLEVIENPNNLLVVIDEVGFGTSPLVNYAYSKVNTPVLFETEFLAHNLTCIASISKHGTEIL